MTTWFGRSSVVVVVVVVGFGSHGGDEMEAVCLIGVVMMLVVGVGVLVVGVVVLVVEEMMLVGYV